MIKKYLILSFVLLSASVIAASLSLEQSGQIPFSISEELSEESNSSLSIESLSINNSIPELLNVASSLEFEVELPEAVSDDSPVQLVGKILNYPNPFSLSNSETTIGYRLSKAAPLTVSIYSLSGYEIFHRPLEQGGEGGSAGYNKIVINQVVLNSSRLSPGVYLYVLIHDGKVLGQNRMVVLP